MNKYIYRLNSKVEYLQSARYEAQLRAINGIKSVLIKDDQLNIFCEHHISKDELDIIIANILFEHLVKKTKKENNDNINEDFEHHKKSAISALLGLAGFEIVKRLMPQLYISSRLLRSLCVLYIAKDIFKEGINEAIAQKRPNADTLTITAVLASLFANKAESSLSLLAISNFAEALTMLAAKKARSNICDLLALDVQEAWIINDEGREQKVDIKFVKPGMVVSFHTGEKICVDGKVVSGKAAVDQSAITGESIPANISEGKMVYAGSTIRLGQISVLVDHVGDETSIARIVHMIEDAHNRRAPVQHFADSMATTLVPVSFIAATVVFAITRDWQRVLNMLFIDFSCGLKLSTATAMSAAISKAAKEGILVKGGSFIEQASNIDTVILDKTGTITKGKPTIVNVTCFDNVNENTILALAACVEEHSSHPMAVAILEEVKSRKLYIPEHISTNTVVSRGIEAMVGDFNGLKGGEVLIGSKTFMIERNVVGLELITERKVSANGSLIYMSLNNKLLAILEISDPIREDFKRTINRLRLNGIEEITMLTGDNKEVASNIASYLGLDHFDAEVLPEDKASYVLKKQRTSTVLMVGDGINDAPALAYADIGVAMGRGCTDTAMQTADVTINSEDPLKLPLLINLGKRTMHIVHQNFMATIGINTAAMMLGALGYITPLFASVVHNAATLGVVLNSTRILFNQNKKSN